MSDKVLDELLTGLDGSFQDAVTEMREYLEDNKDTPMQEKIKYVTDYLGQFANDHITEWCKLNNLEKVETPAKKEEFDIDDMDECETFHCF